MGITNWTPMDWVAAIGAAAWAPQIISWICQYFRKPKITLYLHPETQIGYTSFGPIFNVSLALVSEKRSVTLNDISVNIKHESGALYTFDWDGLSEDLSEIQDPSGQPTSIKRIYLPLVIRVLQSGVAQALVRFQYKPFKQRYKDKIQDAENTFQLLRSAGKLNTEQDIDELASRQEFSELVKLIHSEFIWLAGKYTVTFDFKSPNRFDYRKDTYTFSLSQDDIDLLRKNIDSIKLFIMQNGKSVVVKDYKAKEIVWMWRNPELQKI